MRKTNLRSEVGGVRAQRPQPGNRFVSFVRASGRARARREISYRYLEVFAKPSCSSSSSARPLCFSLFDLKIRFSKFDLLFYMDGCFFLWKKHMLFSLFLTQESKNTVKTVFLQHWGAENQLFDSFYKVC